MVVIGIPLRYNYLKDGRSILLLGEKVRRTFQKAGAFIIPIVPLGDFNYMETKYDEYPLLNELDKEIIEKYIDMCDGIVFPGGCKITPYDEYLLDRCINKNKCILGICLGMQLMSNYKRKFQTELISDGVHFQEDDNLLTHKVFIEKDSLLYNIIGKEEILVNSFHKYKILDSGVFFCNAKSSDGVVEGIELKDKDFVLGVQWHPEISYDFDENSRKIIDYFIKMCEKSKKSVDK